MCNNKKFIKRKEETSKHKGRYSNTNVIKETQEGESEIHSIFTKHVKPLDIVVKWNAYNNASGYRSVVEYH